MAHSGRLGRLGSHLRNQKTAPASGLQPEQPGPAGRRGPSRQNRVDMFEQGYTIVDNMVEPEMLDRLSEAAERLYAEAAADHSRDLNGGLVIHDGVGDGPNAIRGLMAPGMRAPVFAEYMASVRTHRSSPHGQCCAEDS